MIHVRKGDIRDFGRLRWSWSDSPTRRAFIAGITDGTQEFLVAETATGELIGELHIFWRSVDADEADGENRAYLCAFRVHPDYRGQGIGRQLMRRALRQMNDRGVTEATIGVETDARRLKETYHRWGFTSLVKTTHTDHHHIDADGVPMLSDVPTELYLKRVVSPTE